MGKGVAFENEMTIGRRLTTAKERKVINEWDRSYEDMKEKWGESPAKRISELAQTCQQLVEMKN